MRQYCDPGNQIIETKKARGGTVTIEALRSHFQAHLPYSEADRLYFEELGWERVMDIFELEGMQGVVVSVGGKLPVSQEGALPTMGQVNCHRISRCASRRVVLR